MKYTSNLKGQLALTKTELRALELGYIPSRPLFDTRYDLILDNSNQLIKVQVKYANGSPSTSSGAVVVKLAYENRRKEVYTYSENEVDALIVYIPKIDRLCFIPKNVFLNKRNLNIRIKNSKNNQKKGVVFASDYYW